MKLKHGPTTDYQTLNLGTGVKNAIVGLPRMAQQITQTATYTQDIKMATTHTWTTANEGEDKHTSADTDSN